MARRKPYEKIDINVEPFLSIMAIVLKLISLILVVILMRIVMNPNKRRVVNVGVYSGHDNESNPKAPSYIDCRPDGLTLYSSDMPGGTPVTWDDLQRPDNDLERMLDRVQQHKEEAYVVVLARPQSVKFYRTVRKLIEKRPLDVGYDAIDANFKVDWNAAEKALAVSED
jgi:hypothetical protein